MVFVSIFEFSKMFFITSSSSASFIDSQVKLYLDNLVENGSFFKQLYIFAISSSISKLYDISL